MALSGHIHPGSQRRRYRLRIRQAGFAGLGAQLTRRILASGWPKIARRLATHLSGQPQRQGEDHGTDHA